MTHRSNSEHRGRHNEPIGGNLPHIAYPLVITGIVGLIVIVGHSIELWDVRDVLRDAAARFAFPVYGGVVQVLAVMGWTAAASVTGFTALVMPGSARKLGPVAAFTLLLALDDQLQFHEVLLPALGIPQKLVMAAYAGFALLVLRSTLRDILAPLHRVLLLSLCAFALSLFIDLAPIYGGKALFAEDMAKLSGILLWASYWIQQCRTMIRGETGPAGTGRR